MSSASLIQQYKSKGEFDKVDKHTMRIKSSVNHLTQILNDFLSLGKLEEGKIEVNRETMHIENFLSEITEEVNAFLKEGQKISITCRPGLEEINADPRILRNIMFNLISNASKYSEINKPIQITCENSDGRVLFLIKDEGIGIREEDQKHLFERFYRASNAGDIQGTGLGLNIVKRYVELLEGEISFASTYQKGSTFMVSLPLK